LGIHEFDEEDWWHVFEWENFVASLHAFFDGSVIPFNLGYMLVMRYHIDYFSHAGKLTSHGLKLIVGHDDGHLEAPDGTNSHNKSKVLEDHAVFHVVKLTS
jgi:hypothetical protein